MKDIENIKSQMMAHWFHCPVCNSLIPFTVKDLMDAKKEIICPSCGLQISIDHKKASKDVINKINRMKYEENK